VEGSFEDLVRAMDERPEVGAASVIQRSPSGALLHTINRFPSPLRDLGEAVFAHRLGPTRRLQQSVTAPEEYARERDADWLVGAFLIVRAEALAVVGPLDERFFLYSEEVDHAARVRAAGFRIEYVPTARIRHHEGGSGSSAALTALLAVNRIRYVEKKGRGSGAFRAAVALHELLRARDPAHRFALRTVLRRSRWSALPAGPGS
jgi:GT2 family glycosyltransferase